jgi:uncharacterized membrane protein
MLDNWFLLSIAAMLLYGVFDFLYKTAAERRHDIWRRMIRRERHAIEPAGAVLAICAGFLNFAGYLLVLQAFSAGPLSLIHPVFSMAIIIPIALSAVAFKEKLTPRNIIAVVLCLLAIVLIHL